MGTEEDSILSILASLFGDSASRSSPPRILDVRKGASSGRGGGTGGKRGHHRRLSTMIKYDERIQIPFLMCHCDNVQHGLPFSAWKLAFKQLLSSYGRMVHSQEAERRSMMQSLGAKGKNANTIIFPDISSESDTPAKRKSNLVVRILEQNGKVVDSPCYWQHTNAWVSPANQ